MIHRDITFGTFGITQPDFLLIISYGGSTKLISMSLLATAQNAIEFQH